MNALSSQSSGNDHRPLLLFVDDEQRVLNSMRIMFRKEYRLMLANSGSEALDIVRAHPVDVVVSDQRMPRMTGVEVLSRVRSLSPRTVRILLTGYSDLDAIEGSINEGEVFRFLTKPCAPADLRETVRIAVEAAGDAPPEPAAAPAAPDPADPPHPAAARDPAPAVSFEDTATLTPDTLTGAAAGIGETIVLSGDDVAHLDHSPQRNGVLVLSSDESTVAIARAALEEHFDVHVAGNVVHAVRLIEAHGPGVLVTDLSTDPATFRGLTATLKRKLPELVSVVISEHRDVEAMVSLINEGQAFRFLRKPVSQGRCLVSVQAAVNKHRSLVQNPELLKRHRVIEREQPVDPGLFGGLAGKLSGIRRFWASATRH